MYLYLNAFFSVSLFLTVFETKNTITQKILIYKAYGLLERIETVELSVSEFSIKYIFFTPKTEIKLKTDENNYSIQRNLPKWPNLFYIPLSRGLDVILGFIRIRHIMLTKVQCCKAATKSHGHISLTKISVARDATKPI